MLKVFIPREIRPGETRVAATPETVKKLEKLGGLAIQVEAGAGHQAHISDDQYRTAGAEIVPAGVDGWQSADLILKVAPVLEQANGSQPECDLPKAGALLISFMAPHRHLPVVRRLCERGVSVVAMELIPRTTIAQRMDALSSQANLAGYKAVLLGAGRLGKLFPLMMTAAGTIAAAKVLVVGAGVAGLQALATAKRLGALTMGCDVRPAVQQEVESVGGRFFALPMPEIEKKAGGYAKEASEEILRQQREVLAPHVAWADVIITTAQVPGRPAPKLLSREMVATMRPGSVIVDLAVEDGGNCEATELGVEATHAGVTILGIPNLPATLPQDASMLYARNVFELVRYLVKDGTLQVDLSDDLLGSCLLIHEREVRHGPTAAALASGG